MQNPLAGKQITTGHIIYLAVAIVVISALIFSALYMTSRVSAPPANPEEEQEPVYSHSVFGDGEESFVKPMAMTVSGGKVYVTDAAAKKVYVFNRQGEMVQQLGGPEPENGGLEFPYGVGVLADKSILVADMYTGRILHFSDNGSLLGEFGGQSGLKGPAAMLITRDKVFVTDVELSKVFVFDQQGNEIIQFGSPGNGNGELNRPNGIAVNNDVIYVSDTGNNRICLFDSEGNFQSVFYPSGSGTNVLSSPRGLAFSPTGNLLVANMMAGRIHAITAEGRVFYEAAADILHLPGGLAMDGNYLYVIGKSGYHVFVYEYEQTS